MNRYNFRFKKKNSNALVEKANCATYGKIASRLGVKIGLKTQSIVKQLKLTGVAPTILQSIENDRQHIDTLYATGYDVESLYAQLIGRIQSEIIANLPF